MAAARQKPAASPPYLQQQHLQGRHQVAHPLAPVVAKEDGSQKGTKLRHGCSWQQPDLQQDRPSLPKKDNACNTQATLGTQQSLEIAVTDETSQRCAG